MTRHERFSSALPIGATLLLYSRVQAAALLNIGPSTFDRLRKNSQLLRPVRIGSRPLWPYKNLMAFVDELSDGAEPSDPWAVAG